MPTTYCLIVINYPYPGVRTLCVCPETYSDLNEVFDMRHRQERRHGKHGCQYIVEEYNVNKKFLKDGYEQYRE